VMVPAARGLLRVRSTCVAQSIAMVEM
jgi:hypothetical protein